MLKVKSENLHQLWIPNTEHDDGKDVWHAIWDDTGLVSAFHNKSSSTAGTSTKGIPPTWWWHFLKKFRMKLYDSNWAWKAITFTQYISPCPVCPCWVWWRQQPPSTGRPPAPFYSSSRFEKAQDEMFAAKWLKDDPSNFPRNYMWKRLYCYEQALAEEETWRLWCVHRSVHLCVLLLF